MRYKLVYVFLLFCSPSILAQFTVPTVFHSGYEDNTIITQNGNKANITGIDLNYPTLSDWQGILVDNPEMGDFDLFNFYYQGGLSSQRKASRVQDPTSFTPNMVLKFEIKEAYGVNCDSSGDCNYLGRIQANYSNDNTFNQTLGTGFDVFHYSTKMFLPSGYSSMAADTSHAMEWYTLMEFFNNGGWINDDPSGYHAFRVTVNLVKIDGNNDLRLRVKAETRTMSTDWDDLPPLWNQVSTMAVPINSWTNVDIFYKEGDEFNGVFKIKFDGVEVINIGHWTHHPDDNSPDGLTHLQPLKLYTGKNQIDHIKDEYEFDPVVYWDDFKIYSDSKLKKKFMKLVPADCGTTITDSNISITAPFVPDVGPPHNNWLYLFRFQNVANSANVFYKGSYNNTVDLSSFKCDPMYHDADYRIRVRIKNHPYFYDFGSSHDNYCENSTSFFGCTSPSFIHDYDTGFSLSPNPYEAGPLLISLDTSHIELVTAIEILSFTGTSMAFYDKTTLSANTQGYYIPNIELQKGIYFVKVYSNNGVSIKRLLVR